MGSAPLTVQPQTCFRSSSSQPLSQWPAPPHKSAAWTNKASATPSSPSDTRPDAMSTTNATPTALKWNTNALTVLSTAILNETASTSTKPTSMHAITATLLTCEPISTLECPRQNGAFTHEDPSNCREYYWCINGLATLMKCSPGLHFDEFRGQCHWAHEGFREGCVEKRTVLADGFTCPNNVTQQAITGETFDHARYADDADCRNFYTCNNGNEPMKVGCPDGLVFNDVTLICDDPKNVPGCENYYGEEEAAF